MANNPPRKFSEKILLHNQSQSQSTAEFQQVLKEVLDVKKNVNPVQNLVILSQNESINSGAESNQTLSNHISLQQSNQMIISTQNRQHALYGNNGQVVSINQQTSNHLNPNNILTPNCRADSLPALTANDKSRSSIDLCGILSNLQEMKQGDSRKSHQRNRMPSPNNQLRNINPAVRHQNLVPQHSQQQTVNQYQQYNGSYGDLNINPNIPIQTTRSQVNLHYASQQSNNIDQHFVHKSNHSSHHNRINPYYLSAPETNSWRRTNSDSALHQSTAIYCDQQQNVQQPQQTSIYPAQQSNNQFYGSRQRQNVIIQQQSDLNKINLYETDVSGNGSWDPGKIQQRPTNQTNLLASNSQAQGTTMYQNNQKTDLDNVTPITSAPVISINYQNQNTFSSSVNSNNNSSTIYTSSSINQCAQNNYQQQSNSTRYMTQQTNTNEKRPKSCDVEQQENNSNNQFNRNLMANQNVTNRTVGGQLPILQFQSSSQNNVNQQNDHLTLFSNPNSNHIDHQPNHHNSSNAIHVNNFTNNTNSSNFLYANTNTCSGSLPDLSVLNHPPAPLEQEDALSSGLNSNDNSNNSNQSSGSYQFNANHFTGIASSMPNQQSLVQNYRSIIMTNNFVPYNCSNTNSSNSNSPLHNNNAFTTDSNNMTNQQMVTNVGPNNVNFSNKIQDNKYINQLNNNQLATQFNNHHISSPIRPSSNESAEEVIIFNQLAGNDILINNDYENDENIEQFDFDKLLDSDLDKIDTDQDSNNNTNSNLVNFYQDQLMNHRNVSTPSENASSTAPNSPASSIHNLNSPVSSPTAVNQCNNSININNNLANMHLNNDNNLSQNSTILPNKNDFDIGDSDLCVISNQQIDSKNNGPINDEFLQLNFGFDQQSPVRDNDSIFSDQTLNSKDQDILMVNYDFIGEGQTTTASIPNIIFTEHNGDLSSIDELYSEMS